MYRSLDHKTALDNCRRAEISRFEIAIQDFASEFVTMQEKRHLADYAPDAEFRRSDVLMDLSRIRIVIDNFDAVDHNDRCAFAVRVLFNHNR